MFPQQRCLLPYPQSTTFSQNIILLQLPDHLPKQTLCFTVCIISQYLSLHSSSQQRHKRLGNEHYFFSIPFVKTLLYLIFLSPTNYIQLLQNPICITFSVTCTSNPIPSDTTNMHQLPIHLFSIFSIKYTSTLFEINLPRAEGEIHLLSSTQTS